MDLTALKTELTTDPVRVRWTCGADAGRRDSFWWLGHGPTREAAA